MVKDNNLVETDLELYFSADFEVLGQNLHNKLKPGGDSIRVDQENEWIIVLWESLNFHTRFGLYYCVIIKANIGREIYHEIV